MSLLALFLSLVALSLFSTSDAVKVKPSPPPPNPPVPIIPTCGAFVQFTLVKGEFTSSQLKNNNVCNKLAGLINAYYVTPFNWTCQTLTSRSITVQAYPQLQQTKAINSFVTLLKRNVDAQVVMQKIGGSCDDSLVLSGSCPTLAPVTLKRCKAPSPPPAASVCNLTVSLNRATGGLTSGMCASFGANINTLYGTQFVFKCDGLQFGSTQLSVTAPNNYNAGTVIGNLLLKAKNNADASKKLAQIYNLVCGVDKVVFTSGPLYAACAGMTELDFPCR